MQININHFMITNSFRPLLILIVSIVLLGSCTMEKRLYTGGYHIETKSKVHKKYNSKPQPIDNNIVSQGIVSESETYFNDVKNETSIVEASNNHQIEQIVVSPDQNIQMVDDSAACDIIVLKDGDEISAKVIEVTTTDIKYQKCNSSSEVLYTISKQEVFLIKYPDGTKDVIKESPAISKENFINGTENTRQPEPPKRSSVFGILSFIASLVGLFIFGIILAPAAIIFGIIGMGPGRPLKGLAIAGIIIGFISLIALLLYFGTL